MAVDWEVARRVFLSAGVSAKEADGAMRRLSAAWADVLHRRITEDVWRTLLNMEVRRFSPEDRAAFLLNKLSELENNLRSGRK